MKWRNEQIACLNQSTPLDTAQQDSYFNDVVKPNFSKSEARPNPAKGFLKQRIDRLHEHIPL